MKRYLLLLCFIYFSLHAVAQQATYIPAGANVWNFGNVGVYGDITNEGTLGSSPNANLYFFGKLWTNSFTAAFLDERSSGLKGTGGFFHYVGNSGE